MASKSAGSKRRAEDAFQASMQAAIARVVQGGDARDADLVYGRVRGDGHRHYLDADLEDDEGDEDEDHADVMPSQPAKKVQLPPPTASSSSSSSSSSSQSASYASASIEAAFRAGREFGNSEQLPRPPCPVCKLRKERNRVAARESRLKKKNGAPVAEALAAAPVAVTPKYGGKSLMVLMKMESPKAQAAGEEEEDEEDEEEEGEENGKGSELPMQPPPF